MICGICKRDVNIFIFVSLENPHTKEVMPDKWCLSCLGERIQKQRGLEKLDMFEEMLLNENMRDK